MFPLHGEITVFLIPLFLQSLEGKGNTKYTLDWRIKTVLGLQCGAVKGYHSCYSLHLNLMISICKYKIVIAYWECFRQY